MIEGDVLGSVVPQYGATGSGRVEVQIVGTQLLEFRGVSGDAKPRDFGGETRIGVSDAGIGATVGAGVLRIRRGSERRVVGRSAGCLGWARGLELVGTGDE